MLNRCEFIGNLGADPEIRALNDGAKVANFSIAVTKKWKDKNGIAQEKTEWVRCTVYGALAGVIESYVKKGSKVFVAGEWTTRKWTDNNGVERYTTECVVRELEMLDSKSGNGQPSQHQQQKQNGYAPADIDDEIPF